MIEFQSKNGKSITIRRPVAGDARNLIAYSNLIFASTDQVITTPEEYAVSEYAQANWIESVNANPRALVLIAEHAHQIVGMIFFLPNSNKKTAHTGEFGVTVHPQFQRFGIGRKLIEIMIDWAWENPAIEKVLLHVFATNHAAIKLYKDLGFAEEGRHIKAVKQLNGEYVDVLQMYIETKKRD